MDEKPPIEEILDTIGDGRARTVLAALAREPSSAQELTDRLELSQAAVYRRVDDLLEHDLIAERTLVADDGNHYSEYECKFDSTIVSLEGDKYEGRIFRDENLPSRFSDLWKELGNAQ
jgi:DNA-binding transcriptional ArsR family regulator